MFILVRMSLRCVSRRVETHAFGAHGRDLGQSAHGCCEHPVQSSKEQNIAGPIKEVEAKEKEASM